jgi:hypothetical protein
MMLIVFFSQYFANACKTELDICCVFTFFSTTSIPNFFHFDKYVAIYAEYAETLVGFPVRWSLKLSAVNDIW